MFIKYKDTVINSKFVVEIGVSEEWMDRILDNAAYVFIRGERHSMTIWCPTKGIASDLIRRLYEAIDNDKNIDLEAVRLEVTPVGGIRND